MYLLQQGKETILTTDAQMFLFIKLTLLQPISDVTFSGRPNVKVTTQVQKVQNHIHMIACRGAQ